MENILNIIGVIFLAGIFISLLMSFILRVRNGKLLRVLMRETLIFKKAQERGDLFHLILFKPNTIKELRENTAALKEFLKRFPIIAIHAGESLENSSVLLGGVLIKKVEENNDLLKKMIDQIDVNN